MKALVMSPSVWCTATAGIGKPLLLTPPVGRKQVLCSSHESPRLSYGLASVCYLQQLHQGLCVHCGEEEEDNSHRGLDALSRNVPYKTGIFAHLIHIILPQQHNK